MSIVYRLIANFLGLWLADSLIAGFQVQAGWRGLIIATLVLAILNLLVKPVLKLITFPIIIITLGLFLLVINAVILWLTGYFTSYVVITNTLALVEATIIISAVNLLIHKS